MQRGMGAIEGVYKDIPFTIYSHPKSPKVYSINGYRFEYRNLKDAYNQIVYRIDNDAGVYLLQSYVRKNPPFYAHNLYEKKTHGLNLKQMRRLYAMVSRGNQKAITYARNVLGIPFSESPSQVKAVVLHHVRDLAERKVRRNPRGYSNIEKSAFERGAYVGYSPKGVYKIRKMVGKGGWRAMGDISLSFPPRVVTKMLYARDLAEMSKRLQENPLTEDERYHLGRISRDPYLRRHFTGFTRKRKKARRKRR